MKIDIEPMSLISGFGNGKTTYEKKGLPRGVGIGIVVMFIGIAVWACWSLFGKSKTDRTYDKGLELYNTGKTTDDLETLGEARKLLNGVGDYKDAMKYVAAIDAFSNDLTVYRKAEALYENGNRSDAIQTYHSVESFRDSKTRMEGVALELVQEGKGLKEEGKRTRDVKKLDEAEARFSVIPEYSDYYKDAKSHLDEVKTVRSEIEAEEGQEKTYLKAQELENNDDPVGAQEKYMSIAGYKDVDSCLYRVGETIMKKASVAFEAKNYTEALKLIENIDEKKEWTGYAEAVDLKDKINAIQPSENKIGGDEHDTGVSKTQIKTDDNEKQDGNEEKTEVSVKYLAVLDSRDTHYDSSWYHHGFEFKNNQYDNEGGNHSNTLLGGDGYMTFKNRIPHTDQRYNWLRGTLFIAKDCSSTVKDPVKILVQDENGTDLYEKTLLSGDAPESFSIPISTVDCVTIWFYGYHENGGVGELRMVE